MLVMYLVLKKDQIRVPFTTDNPIKALFKGIRTQEFTPEELTLNWVDWDNGLSWGNVPEGKNIRIGDIIFIPIVSTDNRKMRLRIKNFHFPSKENPDFVVIRTYYDGIIITKEKSI